MIKIKILYCISPIFLQSSLGEVRRVIGNAGIDEALFHLNLSPDFFATFRQFSLKTIETVELLRKASLGLLLHFLRVFRRNSLELFHDEFAVVSFHLRERGLGLVGIQEGRNLLRDDFRVFSGSCGEIFSAFHY